MWNIPGGRNVQGDPNMTVEPDRSDAAPQDDARLFGWTLVVASLLALAFAMIHPQLTARDLPGVLRQMADGARFNGWVHGILMALYIVLVGGFTGLSRKLGWARPEVAVATAAYALGALAMMGAAVINGFALSRFAVRYLDIGPDQTAAVAASINMAGSIAGIWAGVGAAATSGAVLAWSLRLIRLPGAARGVGALGILIGIATIGLLAARTLILDLHGFLALVGSQTIWTVAVGVLLIRRRL